MRRNSGRWALSLGTLVLTVAGSVISAAENELFSKVTTESVYSTPNTLDLSTNNTSSADAKLAAAAPSKNTIASRLSEALQQKGFETKIINDRIVSAKAKADNWTFPVIVTMSEDQKNLWLVVLLNVLKDEKQISQENLLALLTANRQHAPAYFSYSPKQRRTELHRPLSTQGLTADSLKAEIQTLTQIAFNAKELWNVNSANDSQSSKVKKEPVSSSKLETNSLASRDKRGDAELVTVVSPATSPLSLVGKWSAAPSDKEGFALQLAIDGKFKLIHVNQGKQTRSQGTFVLDEQQLTLEGDDGRRGLGTIASQSLQEFNVKLTLGEKDVGMVAFHRAK